MADLSHLRPSRPTSTEWSLLPPQLDGRVVLGVLPTEAELLLHERPDEEGPGGDQHQGEDDGQRDGSSGESAVLRFRGSKVLDADVVVNCEEGMVGRRREDYKVMLVVWHLGWVDNVNLTLM